MMKKLMIALMSLMLLAAIAFPAAAYTRRGRHQTRHARVTRSSSRRAYYSYDQPRRRTFWQKHRDKLTVAGSTAGGAIVGGIVGGKKGAAIGAGAGAGSSALYTYKIRKRNRRY